MTINLSASIDDLLNGRIATLTIAPDGTLRPDDPPQGLILSGAFNPLHTGHEGMAAAAARLTGMPVAFELAVVNADKGALEPEDIARRAAQFAGRYTLVLSRAPLFVEKATLYPGRRFVVGYDTAARLIAPRYYGDEAAMRAALEAIRAAGCSFLVAGRLVEGRFCTLADLPVPPDLADLFTPIPETLFRADISSTELRARSRPGA